VHMGGAYVIGELAGNESVTLLTQHLPAHNHPPLASKGNPASTTPQGNLTAGGGTQSIYLNKGKVDTAMNPAMIAPVGGNVPHENMQPFLVMNWVISFFGIFPTPS